MCLKGGVSVAGAARPGGAGVGEAPNPACGDPAPRPDSGAGRGTFPDTRRGPQDGTRLGCRRGTGGRPGWCLRESPARTRLPPGPAGRPSQAGGRDLRRPHLSDPPCFGRSRAAGTRTLNKHKLVMSIKKRGFERD